MEKPQEFSKTIKKQFLDGIFYPSRPAELDRFLENALSEFNVPDFEADGFVIPHGAWDYTLPAYLIAFTYIKKIRPDIIIFFAPFHNDNSGKVYISEYTCFHFPGGFYQYQFPLSFFDKFQNNQYMLKSNIPFDEETAFEALLPVHSMLTPDIPVLPVFCGMAVNSDFIKGFYTQIKRFYRIPYLLVSSNLVLPTDNKNKIDFSKLPPKIIQPEDILPTAEFCAHNLLSGLMKALYLSLSLPSFFYPKQPENPFHIFHQLFIITQEGKYGI